MKEQGFDQWWAAWPANIRCGYQRKGGKSLCLARWIKGLYWTQADQIIKHTEWMKTTADWLKDRGMFIPMPITYLNQQRWDGAEIEVPVIEIYRPVKQAADNPAPMPADIRARINQILRKS